MGWTWEVEAYMPQDNGGYRYEQVYAGESLIAAVRAMQAAKKHCGCVRLCWR